MGELMGASKAVIVIGDVGERGAVLRMLTPAVKVAVIRAILWLTMGGNLLPLVCCVILLLVGREDVVVSLLMVSCVLLLRLLESHGGRRGACSLKFTASHLNSTLGEAVIFAARPKAASRVRSIRVDA